MKVNLSKSKFVKFKPALYRLIPGLIKKERNIIKTKKGREFKVSIVKLK